MSLADAPLEIKESVQDLREAAGDDELVVAFLREITELSKKRYPHGGGLTASQARFLIESGDFTEAELAETEAEVSLGALASQERQTRLGAIERTVSAAEAAEILGIDESRVRHRRSKQLLYGFLVGGKRRYPQWQFIPGAGRAVPNLARVIEAIPDNWHPAAIEGFMTTPKESLRLPGPGGTDAVSPVDWLLADGDPQAVVDILDSFLQS